MADGGLPCLNMYEGPVLLLGGKRGCELCSLSPGPSHTLSDELIIPGEFQGASCLINNGWSHGKSITHPTQASCVAQQESTVTVFICVTAFNCMIYI